LFRDQNVDIVILFSEDLMHTAAGLTFKSRFRLFGEQGGSSVKTQQGQI